MPMTPDNIATIQEIYAAFGRADVPSLLACLDENVQWEPGYAHNSDIPWLATGNGHAHVVRFLEALRVFDIKRFEVLAVMGSGPWVVALTSLELTHKQSGRILVEACEPHVWRFNEAGKVVSMRHAADTRAHARIAGLD